MSKKEEARQGELFPPDDVILDIWDEQGRLVAPVGKALLRFLVNMQRRADGSWLGGSLTLWHDGSFWRLSLHDRARGIVTYLRSSGITQLLCDAEDGLETETLPWRPSTP